MKKIISLILALLMIVTVTGCSKNKKESGNESSQELQQLLNDWFVEDIGSDYLNLHYTVKDPSVYGIEVPEVTLGEVDSSDDAASEIDARIAALEALDSSKFSDADQVEYETQLAYLETLKAYYALETDCSFVFTPNSGVNNNLVTNFTEFEIRSEQDAKDLITLVEDSGRYIDECIEYTKSQAEEGIVQTNATMDSVIEQCQRFIANVEDNEVIKAFNAQIDELGYSDGDELEKELSDAVINTLIPAYQRIIDMYQNDLYGKCTTSGATCEYEGGKEYYAVLLQDNASSNKSVEELESMLENGIDEAVNGIIATMNSMSQLEYSKWSNASYDYGYSDPYEILDNFKSLMTEDFPEIPEVNYSVNYLDPSVTSDNIVAYYMLSPVDDVTENVIKVNQSYTEDDANYLCITLSHEGYPGHCYQHTYYYSKEGAYVRYITDFLGYAEGWAMYVEDWAYSVLSPSDNIAQIDSLYDQLNYYLYAYIDILYNYEGYAVDDVANYLSNYFQDEYAAELAEEIRADLIGDPAMFAPYGLGMLQMLTLRETAMDALGDNFDLKEFNKVILDAGDTTFEILEEQVNQYIEDNE